MLPLFNLPTEVEQPYHDQHNGNDYYTGAYITCFNTDGHTQAVIQLFNFSLYYIYVKICPPFNEGNNIRPTNEF